MKLREVHIRWIGIFLVAFIAMEPKEKHMVESSWAYRYVVSLCFTAVYWNGSVFIIRWFRRVFPEMKRTAIRLVCTGLGVVVWMTLGGIPIKLMLELHTVEEMLTFQAHTDFLPFTLIIATVVSLSYEAFYFFDKWKEQFMLNEQLKNQQMKTQYEVLQNQMSPHFLFNSLNTLTAIISENPEVAVRFTEELSDVYRYILNNKERELVPLAEELDFLNSYLFLLRMRYPDNLTTTFDIAKKHYERTIPPLTLQMLVENAIKHNVVSKTKPLHIHVYMENDRSLVVKNTYQPKESLERSTQTGLENIRKRYRILGAREIDVITSAAHFMVAVPLIDLLEEIDLQPA